MGYRSRTPFRVALCCLGFVVISGGPLAAEVEDRNATQLENAAENAVRWLAATELHSPGESDESAVAVGGWPISRLADAVKFVTRLARQKEIAGVLRSMNLLNEPPREGAAQFRRFLDDPNRGLKRGALLHADIAMLQLDTGSIARGSTQLLVEDGRGTPQGGGEHWEIARLLLDGIDPDPSGDSMVRQWYTATGAFMLARRKWGFAETHFNRALEIFPTDSKILFYAGTVHENYASPEGQGIHVQWKRARLGSKESELKKARELLKRSIEGVPGFAEAHLHLGRVLGLLGDHAQAVAELGQATAATADPFLQYYVSLYLGNELAQLNRGEEARKQFERAAALYPSAQSPLLGLSHLARISGDFNGASLAVQRVFKLPAGDGVPADPWWVYDVSHVRNVLSLLSGMYGAFGRLR